MKDLKNKISFKTLSNDPKTLRAYETELEQVLAFKDTINRLSDALTTFEDKLLKATNQNEFLDAKLARELYVTASALLRICQKIPFAEHVPFTLAAVSYFINPRDGHNDAEDIDGFEDDKTILTMIIKQFRLQSDVENEIREMQNQQENKGA